MKFKKRELVLVVILVLVLALKIYFVAQVAMPSYDSFFAERQIDSIKDSGKPLHFDPLSYQGRTHVGNGFFYYALAVLSIIVPSLILFKYIAVVLGIIALVFIFLITKKLFPARWVGILVTTLAALSPSLFSFSLNEVTPGILFFVLYLILIYSFMQIDSKPNAIVAFLVTFVIAAFTSSLILGFALGAGIYFVLLRLEFLPIKKREFELLFFSGIFAFWYYILLFKKLFTGGVQALWGGIPKELLADYFSGMTVPLALSLVGFVPMLLGFYAIYMVLFTERNRKLLLLVSLAFSWGLLTWLGFIPFKEGIIFGTVTLALLSAYTINKATSYLKKTKLSFMRPVLAISLLVLVLIAFIPVFSYVGVIKQGTPTPQELETMVFIKENTPEDATILGTIQDGHIINAVAERKNFFDEQFLFAPQAQQRYDDAKKVFFTRSEVVAKQVFRTYLIDYVYISTNTERVYAEQNLFEESTCFENVFETEQTKVYEFTCKGNT